MPLSSHSVTSDQTTPTDTAAVVPQFIQMSAPGHSSAGRDGEEVSNNGNSKISEHMTQHTRIEDDCLASANHSVSVGIPTNDDAGIESCAVQALPAACTLTEDGLFEIEEDVGDVMSPQCGGTRCLWLEIGEEVLQKTMQALEIQESDEAVNHLRRKQAYKIYTYERYGYLGKGTRKQIPHCAMAAIRSKWPDPVGSYLGYRSQ